MQVFYTSALMLYLSRLEILRANLSCLTMVGQIESDVFMYNQVYFYNPHINTKFNIKLVNLYLYTIITVHYPYALPLLPTKLPPFIK